MKWCKFITGLVILGTALLAVSCGKQNLQETFKNEESIINQTEQDLEEKNITIEEELNSLEDDEKKQYIRTHSYEYPEELLELLSENEETLNFVYAYPKLADELSDLYDNESDLTSEIEEDNSESDLINEIEEDDPNKDESKLINKQLLEEKINEIALTEEELNSERPLFLQWDIRWGAIPYGQSMIALAGCGPTCLSMVAVALTGDETITPPIVAEYAMENGYYVKNAGSVWGLISEGSEGFGLEAKEIGLSETGMAQHLTEDSMLICSMAPGDFTKKGHYIVVYDYEDGYFSVNDPNSITNSNRKWDYETLKPQIRNIWAMTVKG